MGLVERQVLVAEISPPFDRELAERLVGEFVSIERRFIQRDWEPASLDGGQFAEILARAIYHLDSGNLSPQKGVGECIKYIENEQTSHALQPRSHALHLMKVVETIYKFRSARGAVHISPTYGPNHMDAKLIVECVRWCMSETLRLFWRSNDREVVARVIRELLQFEVPCIGVYKGVLLVQRTDLLVEEEVLLLLHYAGEAGMTRKDLGLHVRAPSSSVSDAIKRLCGVQKRQVVSVEERYRLTDLGSRRVHVELADKLLTE